MYSEATICPRDGAAITTDPWSETADRFAQVMIEKRRSEAAIERPITGSVLHTMLC